MKYIIALILMLLAFTARADQILNAKWDIIGIQDSRLNLVGGVKAVEGIELDVRWGQGYMGIVNGMVTLADNIGIAAVGSCLQYTDSLGCDLQVRGAVYRLDLDSDTGAGELQIIGADGFAVEEGAAVLKSIQ